MCVCSMVAEPRPDTGLVLASELLQDHLAFQVTAELVDPEELAVVEGGEVVDIDLPGLEKGHQSHLAREDVSPRLRKAYAGSKLHI